DGLCCLGQPDDIEELSHLVGKWMKPKDLMESLKAAGVNVFPAEDADKYVSINKKDDRLEKEMYQEMSLTASAFAYSWSKWNAESGEDRIVLQTTEQLQDEMLLE
ncbi:Protein CASC1, partial [Exaiptasia diaphana]